MSDSDRHGPPMEQGPPEAGAPLIELEDVDAPVPPFGSVGFRRDRIVLLGQPQSGKTVYLARLYDLYFRSPPNSFLSMRTLNGQVHLKLMELVDAMDQGFWPAATGGITYVDLEIRYRGERFEVVSLDYPGEVFSKAFLLGKRDADCLELIEHLDRAAGIIMMIDPSVVANRSRVKAAETEFGMTAAIRYVKDRRDGLGVPVALLFTKLDRNEQLLRSAGGLRGFAETYCAHILSEVPGLKLFSSAAVREEIGPGGRSRPCLRKRSIGLENAFLYCLDVLVRTRLRDRERERGSVPKSTGLTHPGSGLKWSLSSDESARERRIWIVFIMLTALLIAGGVALAMWIVSPGPKAAAEAMSP